MCYAIPEAKRFPYEPGNWRVYMVELECFGIDSGGMIAAPTESVARTVCDIEGFKYMRCLGSVAAFNIVMGMA